jgi:hypothetical protein
MIKLELDEQEAWFLTQILDNALDNHDLFLTVDENDEETFDGDFHDSVMDTRNKLIEVRLNITKGSEE